MKNVNILINGQSLTANADMTILEAASANDILIPTLCMLRGLDPKANCRICVVEVEGREPFQPACATKVAEGMVINTDTPEVRRSRKTTLELLLARHAVDCHHCLRIGSSKCDDLDPYFCEMCFFCDCVRDGICELQALAREYKVDALPYELEPNLYETDFSTKTVIRNPNKCVKCRRCVDICRQVQTVDALSVVRRGKDVQVLPSLGKALADSPCVQCGRCIKVCPTGAIYALEEIDELLYQAHRYEVKTVAQVSPDVLQQLAELSGMEPEQLDIRRVAAGLFKVGVDYVVTDELATELAMAESSKLLSAAMGTTAEPVIISDSYPAIQFLKKQFKDLDRHLIELPSVQRQFDEYIKTIWAKKNEIEPASIRTITITSNHGGETEATNSAGSDYVLNARELYRMFLRTGVNLKTIPPREFSDLGGSVKSDKASSGLLLPVTWEIDSSIEELTYEVAGREYRAVIGKTLGHARQLLTQLAQKSSSYDIIRISS